MRRDTINRGEAERRLDHIRGLRIRLLGDRVLQQAAWLIAERLDRPDMASVEYLALTELQGGAFVTLDAGLAREVAGIVPLSPIEDLILDPAAVAPGADGQQGRRRHELFRGFRRGGADRATRGVPAARAGDAAAFP